MFKYSLLTSKSKEVAVVSKLVSINAQTVTGLNLLNIRKETNQTQYSNARQVRKALYDMYFDTQSDDEWKTVLLFKYLRLRKELRSKMEETSYIDDLINSLCSS